MVTVTTHHLLRKSQMVRYRKSGWIVIVFLPYCHTLFCLLFLLLFLPISEIDSYKFVWVVFSVFHFFSEFAGLLWWTPKPLNSSPICVFCTESFLYRHLWFLFLCSSSLHFLFSIFFLFSFCFRLLFAVVLVCSYLLVVLVSCCVCRSYFVTQLSFAFSFFYHLVHQLWRLLYFVFFFHSIINSLLFVFLSIN